MGNVRGVIPQNVDQQVLQRVGRAGTCRREEVPGVEAGLSLVYGGFGGWGGAGYTCGALSSGKWFCHFGKRKGKREEKNPVRWEVKREKNTFPIVWEVKREEKNKCFPSYGK